MQAMRVMKPGGLDQLKLVDSEAGSPGHGEVLVRWRASSLNFHDYMVALGAIPSDDGRIPMSDGAGEIIEVGEGVTKWKIGDKVCLLYTSPSPRDATLSRMPSSA